jgi:succinoglycan biosynthesis transport protein ExoP
MLDTKIQCIGIVSLLPGEGKSTVASNLAHAFSAAGRRTLLVDCDARSHALSTSLAASSQHGLVELLTGSSRIDQAVLQNKRPKPALLPIVARSSIANFNDILSSESMRRNVQHFREVYDVIFIDLPAMTSGPEVRAISPLLDAIIVVAAFNNASSDALRTFIQTLDRPSPKVLGIILNKFVS